MSQEISAVRARVAVLDLKRWSHNQKGERSFIVHKTYTHDALLWDTRHSQRITGPREGRAPVLHRRRSLGRRCA